MEKALREMSERIIGKIIFSNNAREEKKGGKSVVCLSSTMRHVAAPSALWCFVQPGADIFTPF